MTPWLACSAALLVTVPALSACSGSSVDSACEVDALTDEIGHILEEGGLSVGSVDAVRCSGPWSVVVVTVAGDEPSTETFILTKVGDSWVLKAPETACEGGESAIPEALAEGICPTAS